MRATFVSFLYRRFALRQIAPAHVLPSRHKPQEAQQTRRPGKIRLPVKRGSVELRMKAAARPALHHSGRPSTSP
jgi:hypothetical protein